MLVAARLRHVAGSRWGMVRYARIERIKPYDKIKGIFIKKWEAQEDIVGLIKEFGALTT